MRNYHKSARSLRQTALIIDEEVDTPSSPTWMELITFVGIVVCLLTVDLQIPAQIQVRIILLETEHHWSVLPPPSFVP